MGITEATGNIGWHVGHSNWISSQMANPVDDSSDGVESKKTAMKAARYRRRQARDINGQLDFLCDWIEKVPAR